MSENTSSEKPWGGRFTESTDAFVEAFTASIGFDQRLYRHDIAGSIAHARMLAHVGIITAEESGRITGGLQDILADIERGDFAWSVSLEDIHMNIEARLIDRIGETGKKLHTGRSRNDQVATDLRLYLREEIDVLGSELTRLQAALLELAEREVDTILPGFTHLQVAMPRRWSCSARQPTFNRRLPLLFENCQYFLTRTLHRSLPFYQLQSQFCQLHVGLSATAGYNPNHPEKRSASDHYPE